MTIARLRSPFKDPKSRSSAFIIARYRGAVLLLVRGMAGAIVVVGWVLFVEAGQGGL